MTDFEVFEDQEVTLNQLKDQTRREIEDEYSCQQLSEYGEYGLGASNCIGCKRFRNLIPMKSAAGWYLGTRDTDGAPMCRATTYMDHDQALVFMDQIARLLTMQRIGASL